MRKSKLSIFFTFTLVTLFAIGAKASENSADSMKAIYITQVDAPISKVWQAFSTKQGLESWMAPVADVDMKVGGLMLSNYDANGSLEDESAIANSILSFEPERMLSLKASKFPKDFPFVKAAKKTWSIFYFTPISVNTTEIKVVGLGYTDSEESKKMRSFFEGANSYSLNQLKKALAKK